MFVTGKQAKILKRCVSALGYALVGALFILNGILGYRVTRWEAILWGLITLAYMYANSRAALAVSTWRELARYQTEQVEEARTYPVIVLKPDQPEE